MGIFRSEFKKRALSELESSVEKWGYEIVDLDAHPGPKGFLRVFVELKNGSTPSADECATLSRQVSELLDGSELFATGFDLEISSPGLDRRLARIKDFEKAVGQIVKLELAAPNPAGSKKLSGRLKDVSQNRVTLEQSGNVVVVELLNITKANQIWRNADGF